MPVDPAELNVLGGKAGIAYFYASMYKYFQQEVYLEEAIRRLEIVVDGLNAGNLLHQRAAFSIGDGVAGVAWVLERMRNMQCLEESEINAELEDMVTYSLQVDAHARCYDLFYGVVGKGVYFLERYPEGASFEQLVRIVDMLEDFSTYENGYRKWPDQLKMKTENGTEPIYNMGLAHGLPSIIIFLCKVIHTVPAITKARTLLTDALHWLRSFRTDTLNDAYYPSLVVGNACKNSGNLSWCYGDLGIAVALLSAYEITKEQAHYDEAIQLAQRCSLRRLHNSGIKQSRKKQVHDVCFCHGSAGLANLFHRIYQKSGCIEMKVTAEYWLHTCLYQGRNNGLPDSIGGFMGATVGKDRRTKWRKDPGLLNGASGVGLCLLSFADGSANNWDSLFLTN